MYSLQSEDVQWQSGLQPRPLFIEQPRSFLGKAEFPTEAPSRSPVAPLYLLQVNSPKWVHGVHENIFLKRSI